MKENGVLDYLKVLETCRIEKACNYTMLSSFKLRFQLHSCSSFDVLTLQTKLVEGLFPCSNFYFCALAADGKALATYSFSFLQSGAVCRKLQVTEVVQMGTT